MQGSGVPFLKAVDCKMATVAPKQFKRPVVELRDSKHLPSEEDLFNHLVSQRAGEFPGVVIMEGGYLGYFTGDTELKHLPSEEDLFNHLVSQSYYTHRERERERETDRKVPLNVGDVLPNELVRGEMHVSISWRCYLFICRRFLHGIIVCRGRRRNVGSANVATK